MNNKHYNSSNCIKGISLFFSICFLIACPIAAFYLDIWPDVWHDFIIILLSPSPLVTDYFQTGNLSSAFLNAALCGFGCCAFMYGLKVNCRPPMLAGYFLVVAHCFYGLNFLNMWPPFIGILIFCKIKKLKFRDNLDMAMFATAFGPFISELLFRYHAIDDYLMNTLHISLLGIIYMILFTVFLGIAIPAMLPGALKLHKGYNLYNGGLAFGLLGFFLYAFMYKTFGLEPPTPHEPFNPIYAYYNNSYQLFVTCFFAIVFSLILAYGWWANGKSFKGYGELLKSTGHKANFFESYGAPLVCINIGIYGFMLLAYFSFVVTFTDGAGFTGATTGIILAALTFSSQGQHPKNVWPVLLGYAILSAYITGFCTIAGLEIPWSLSTQGYMNGAAFATGLCPIVGKFGRRWGVLAGIMCAVMCTSTSAIHGGFVLYNGGLTSGITALILIPCIEYYSNFKVD